MLKSVALSSTILTAAVVLVTAAVVLTHGGSAAQAAAWAVVLALATRVVPILLSFVIAFWPRRGATVPTLGGAALTRLVARESWAIIRLFFFYHPFEKWITRQTPDTVVGDETPVVLVHGFYANAGFWERTKRALEAAGWHNLYSLNLEPPFSDIDLYARQLHSRIEAACHRCRSPDVIIVAHSMGGLVARACAAQAPARVRHIICLGTPHQGTVLARLLPLITTRQMRPGSEWLRALGERETSSLRLTNIYSEHDNIIVPQVNARRGDVNIPVSGIGHLDMAFSAAFHRELCQVLDKSGHDAQSLGKATA